MPEVVTLYAAAVHDTMMMSMSVDFFIGLIKIA